jgi:hypothetical protein
MDVANGTTNGNHYDDGGLIRFDWDSPVNVALQFSEGKQVEGRYGDSLLFSCTNGRRFFAPLSVGPQLTALGIQPGEAITITKRKRGKAAVYEVGRAGDPIPRPAAAPAPVRAPAPRAAAPAPAPAADASAAATQPPPTVRRTVYEYYKAAIDILAESEKYAKARGFEVEFNGEDVRALAATLIIQRKEWPSWQL